MCNDFNVLHRQWTTKCLSKTRRRITVINANPSRRRHCTLCHLCECDWFMRIEGGGWFLVRRSKCLLFNRGSLFLSYYNCHCKFLGLHTNVLSSELQTSMLRWL